MAFIRHRPPGGAGKIFQDDADPQRFAVDTFIAHSLRRQPDSVFGLSQLHPARLDNAQFGGWWSITDGISISASTRWAILGRMAGSALGGMDRISSASACYGRLPALEYTNLG
jgi:hypothetical protein